MVDTTRGSFPPEMYAEAHGGGSMSMETVAGEAVERLKRYAQEQPVPAMLWALGLGFILGWKLKPW